MLIQNGHVIDPATGRDELLDIRIEGGRIAGLGKYPGAAPGETVIDARGCIVAPGLIDAHVHFRDPGLTHKEDIVTGAASAAAGGYTTVICMANTRPPVDSVATLADLRRRAEGLPVRVLNAAAVTVGMQGRELADLAALKQAGAVSFTDDGMPIRDTGVMLAALRACKELGMLISLHEEDPDLIGSAGVNQGAASRAVGVEGAPAVAEEVMVARDCLLALHTGAAINIQHLSSARSVEILRTMKRLGARVSAEVTPQHLSLNEDIVLQKGTLAKVNPPIRTESDRFALIQGLKDGVIDVIATDHAPHAAEEKAMDMRRAPSGMIGLETALALCLTHLVRAGHLTMMDMLGKMTVNPARLYGLEGGSLREGAPADIVVFDEHQKWTVGERFHSRSSNSPFIGMELWGKVKYTVCNGKMVYSDRK